MTELFVWIENTAFATWVRESPSQFAYTGMLFLHAAGLALSVGVSVVIALRILGGVAGIPLSAVGRLFRPLWIGFWINFVSGVALMSSNMSGEMANTVFLIKLTFVALASITMWIMQRMVGPVPTDLRPARPLAVAALVFWVAAVTFGRFVAYPGLLGFE
jgi:hypothetical protein